jgi:hypothetical protein
VRVDLRMMRVAQFLDTVRVTASANPRRDRLAIDADAIANSSRAILSGLDVIIKLRPDMVYGLGGSTVCPQAARDIWVNGVRIRFVPGDFLSQQKARELRQLNFHPPPAIVVLGPDVRGVLATIKPEHIASIVMHDCMEMFMGSEGGIFGELKSGVRYEPGVGSLVVTKGAQDSILDRIVRKPAVAVTSLTSPRLLGLYDALTGEPIVDADIIEAATGTRAKSSATGSASLDWMTPGPGIIWISKFGYRSDTIAVSISALDTVPITVVLTRIEARP